MPQSNEKVKKMADAEVEVDMKEIQRLVQEALAPINENVDITDQV
jgi:hypothetical protein